MPPRRHRRIIKNVKLKDLEGKERNLLQRNGFTYVSKEIDSYADNPFNSDSVFLITQFFIHSDPKRQEELNFCVKKNIPVFDKIYLLNEKIYSQEELDLAEDEMQKIEQIDIKKRLTYYDIFKFVKEKEIKGYITFCNLDIFFDETFPSLLRKTSLSERKTIRALTRREFKLDRKLEESYIKPGFNKGFSQDSWCIHSNYINIEDEKLKEIDFYFGKLGCDNRFTMVMFNLGFRIINDANFLKTYHYHSTEVRNYSNKDMEKPPYLWVPIE